MLSSTVLSSARRYLSKQLGTSYATVRFGTPVLNFNVSQRAYGTRIRRLTKDAEEDPADPAKQAALFNALNSEGYSSVVISRFEQGNIGKSEEVIAAYLKALTLTNQFTKEKVSAVAPSVYTNSVMEPSRGIVNEVGVLHVPNRLVLDNSSPLKVEVSTKASPLMNILKLLGFVGSICIIAYMLSPGADPAKSLGLNTKSKKVSKSNVKFSDVKGSDDAKEQLEEIVEYLKNPKKFSALGGKLPKGVLLYGPPGTGKTLLAKAVAGEADVPFFYAAGAEFDEVFVGLGARRIRNLFSEAKMSAPAIIFIDEIETIGTSRKKTIQLSSRDATINQLLTELDGFVENSGVIVIAATNFVESLDEALTRPGRFDKKISIDAPDMKGRKDIIELYLSKVVHVKDINSEILARATIGFTGADLYNMINISALNAAKANMPAVNMHLLEDALDEVRMGVANKSRVLDPANRRQTAYHEAGHALVNIYTEGSPKIHKATLLPRGQALGMVSLLGEADSTSRTKKEFLADIAIAMGGRAAEEIIYGADNVGAGASNDFSQATRVATNMVKAFGMGDNTGVRLRFDNTTDSDYSLSGADEEINRILMMQYHYARSLLKSKEKELHLLANSLIERETLTAEEIDWLLKEGKLRPLVPKKAASFEAGIHKPTPVKPVAKPATLHTTKL